MLRVIACAVLLMLGFFGSVQASTADDAFKALYEREWQWRMKEFPLLATSVGVHDYDHLLGHVDIRTEKQRLRWLKALRAELLLIDSAELAKDSQVNFAIFRAQLDNAIANRELKAYLIPMTSDSSFYADLVSLAETHPFATAKDFENYLQRLSALPTYFDEHIELLRAGLQQGMTLPRVVLAGREGPIRAIAESKDINSNPFYAPFLTIPSTISTDAANRLRAQGAAVMRSKVQPAYQRLLKFFVEEYQARARQSIAAFDLPNGAAFYQAQIREFTTLDLAPAAIHQTGLDEMARIRREMDQVILDSGFKGDFAAFLKFLRTDPRFYAKTSEEILMRASYIAKRIDGELPGYFSKLPRLPYGIAPVPSDIAPYYTSGRYSPAPEGAKLAGFYWVNTTRLESRPLYALPALTLHEAVPGHHLQMALASEQAEQPPFRRHSYISAFGEGWGLYAEHLGVEMGIYETPYEHFGRLTYEMWRAARLVADTGIHAMGWSRDRALALFRDNSALSEHEITTEVDRYISWPGQALSYKLGEMKIRGLRAEAEAALGDRFDLRAFHDAVLELGSVPLPELERHMRGWIELQNLDSLP